MKRMLMTAMCFVFIYVVPVITFAEQEGVYENAGELYQAWGNSGMPDYVSGVWSTDGGSKNLTIGIVDDENCESAKQEILDLIIDDSTVTITYQEYARYYLMDILDEFNTLFHQDLGLVAVGLNDTDNRVEIDIHSDFMDNSSSRAMIKEMTDMYGDAVSFSYVSSYPVPLVDDTVGGDVFIRAGSNHGNFAMMILFLLAVCAVAVFSLVYLQKQTQLRAMIIEGESVIAHQKRISSKQIKEKIRETDVDISAELDSRIMDSINSLENKDK